MLFKMRKKISFLLILVLVATSFLGGGMETYAGGVEEGGTETDADISSASFATAFDEDGYYPASLEYVLRSMRLNVTYADGTSSTVQYWSADDYSEDYRYFTWADGENCYNIRFYDAEGNQVKITSTHVPIGEFTLKVNRNEEAPFYETQIKILDPVSGNVDGNSASFSGEDHSKIEELWYEFSPAADKLYVYTPSGSWPSSNGFAGIWVKNDDNTVDCVCKGLGMYGGNFDNFTYTATGEDTLYMVIGEARTENFSGTMIWNEKKDVKSLNLNPAASHKAWNGDIMEIPLTITYTDESQEVINHWNESSYLPNAPEASSSYVYVNSLYVTTANADTIYLGAYDGTDWVDCSIEDQWKPGTETWKAYLESDPTIASALATVKIASPTINTISFADGESTKFSLSSGKVLYYKFTPDADAQLENVNSGSKSITEYFYKKESGFWRGSSTSLISAGTSSKSYVEAGCEYLVILTAAGSTEGTIGKYTVGTSKSAVIDTATLDATDYALWSKLPITVSFVAEDGKTAVGSQTIASWNMDYSNSGVGYARTKYNETIYYVLYNGSTKVNIPVLSEEMAEYIGNVEDEEELNAILQELGFPGGAKDLVVPAGNYTVKVYLKSISDDAVIGTGSLKVTGGTCTEHQWNKGTVTKKATMSAAGTRTFTCTACGEKKTKTIAKVTSIKLSATKPTYTGNKISPTVTVKDNAGNKLVQGTDYTVTYGSSTRKNVGRYSVTVTFKGAYNIASQKLWFTIAPKAPATMNAELYGYDDVKVSWSKSTGASGYAVYYKKNADSEYKLLGRTTYLYMKTKDRVNLADGVNYRFKVVPYYKNSSGTRYLSTKYITDTVYTLKKLSAPTVKTSDLKVKVTWNNISGETGYQISRSTSSTGTNIVLTKKTTSGTSAIVKATKGKKYYYKVRAYKVIDDNGTRVFGPWSKVTSYKR